MTDGHSPWNRSRRTPRVHAESVSPWWRRLLKSWIARLTAFITAVVTATAITLATKGTESVVGSRQSAPASSTPQQRSREAWTKDVNRVCSQYIKQMNADYNTIHIAGAKITERSERAQKTNEEQRKGSEDLLADITVLLRGAFDAISRTEANYGTIESEIASLNWPTRAADEKLARDWWSLYHERKKKFEEVYTTVGAYLSSTSPLVRPTLFGQFVSAMVQYVKISDEFYSTSTSLGINYCR
jgi:hypothetical protein